jgi:hypothetical protein
MELETADQDAQLLGRLAEMASLIDPLPRRFQFDAAALFSLSRVGPGNQGQPEASDDEPAQGI